MVIECKGGIAARAVMLVSSNWLLWPDSGRLGDPGREGQESFGFEQCPGSERRRDDRLWGLPAEANRYSALQFDDARFNAFLADLADQQRPS